MKKLMSLLFFLMFLTACSQDSLPDEQEVETEIGNTGDQLILEPNEISYNLTDVRYFVNSPISTNNLSFKGSKDSISFSTLPALPEGLSINPNTGSITGIPTSLKNKSFYTVNIQNEYGSGTITLSIEVVIPPPKKLSYTDMTDMTLFNNILIQEPKIPSVDGFIDSFSISPMLPNGMIFSTTTGEISGKPTELKERTAYTVSAINSTGESEFNFFLRVIDIPPENLNYNIIEATYMVNQTVSNNSPFYGGGVPTLFISEPINLPAGLQLNALTGVISGRPLSEVKDFIEYKITAINSGGESSTFIKIKVEDIAPGIPLYKDIIIDYTKDVEIIPNILQCAGIDYNFEDCPDGKPTTVQIQPSLPDGLVFNSYSGIISGTPINLIEKQEYTVITSNSGGTRLGTFYIGVIDKKPLNLKYKNEIYSIRKDESFSTISPLNVGGSVVSYTLDTSLPLGLIFDSNTGKITGTPTEVTESFIVTITGINSGGQDTFSIVINVLPVPFYAFNYKLVEKKIINNLIEYSIEVENISREFDDSRGISLSAPIDINSAESNFEKNISATESTCLILDNDNNKFEYLDKCILKFTFDTPNPIPLEMLVTISASEVLSKVFNLSDFIDITPKNIELISDRKTIVKAIVDIQSLGVDTNLNAFYQSANPVVSLLRDASNLTNQTISSYQTNFIAEQNELLEYNSDPDTDGSEGINVFNNIDFINNFSLTGEYENYTPECEIEIPFRNLIDCEIGSFSIESFNINETGVFRANISLKEGLSSEVGISNSIGVDVYKVKRIINTELPPSKLVVYNNKIYFSGLTDSNSTNTRKLLSYNPFSETVRQVSKFLNNGDDRAFPFAQLDGLLFFKGRDPISNSITFFVYDESLDKISPFYTISNNNNSGISAVNNFDELQVFKFKGRIYFPVLKGLDTIWIYYDRVSNTLSRVFEPIYISNNNSNGNVIPEGFVSYNNKLFFYSFLFNDSINSGGYKLQSVDDVQGVHRWVSNINIGNDDYLTNGVVYDNKIFYIANSPSVPTQSSLVYYDEISDSSGKFSAVFNAEGTGSGEIIGLAYGKLFFSLPDEDRDILYYYDGASRTISKVYSTNNINNKIRKIKNFSNLENKQIIYFIEEDSVSGSSSLIAITQDLTDLKIKKVVDGNSLYLDKSLSMFNYNNTLFFSCDNSLESLCSYNKETEVVSKIVDSISLKINSQPMDVKAGVVIFNNRVYFGSDETATGQKAGVFEMCLSGANGCLD